MTAKFIKVTKTSPRSRGTDGPYWREVVVINTSNIATVVPINSKEAGHVVDPDDEARALVSLRGKEGPFYRVKETVEEINTLLEGQP